MEKGKILIITGDAGESYETLYAKHRLMEAGFEPIIAAPSKKTLNLVIHDFEPGWDTYIEKPGYYVESDTTFEFVNPDNFLAILLIGGRAPEYLRHDHRVVNLVKTFHQDEKYIFAICHGVQILIAAGLVEDRQIACYENIRFEVTSCGGEYIRDQEAIREKRIVTGKTWQSHPAFYRLVMECLDSLDA